MEANKILSADILDLVFEHRNKDYGAYELRKTYNKRIVMALIITASVALLAVLGSVVASTIDDGKSNKVDIKEVTLADIKQEEEKPNAEIEKTDHRIVDSRHQPPTARRRPDALQFADLAFGPGVGIWQFHHPPPPPVSRRK